MSRSARRPGAGRLLALLVALSLAGGVSCASAPRSGPGPGWGPEVALAGGLDALPEVEAPVAAAAPRSEEDEEEPPPVTDAPPLPAQPPEKVEFTDAPRDTRETLRYAIGRPVLLLFTGEAWDRKLAKVRGKLQILEEKCEGLKGVDLLCRTPGGDGWRSFSGFFYTERAVNRHTATGRDLLRRTKLLPSGGRTAELGETRFGDRGVNPAAAAAPSILLLLSGRMELPLLPADVVGPGRPEVFTLDADEGRFQVVVSLEQQGVLDGRDCWRVVWMVRPVGQLRYGISRFEMRIETLWGRREKRPVRVRTVVQMIRYNIWHQTFATWKLEDRRELSGEDFDEARKRFELARRIDRTIQHGLPVKDLPGQVKALEKLDPKGVFATLCERGLNHHHSVLRAHTVTPGMSRQGLAPEDTYYHLYVPKDYRPAAKYRLLVVLHGHGNEPGGYFRHWVEAVEGKPYIVVAPKSRGLSWEMERDMTALRSILVPLAATYSVDPDRFFVVGHSAGAKFAYVVAYASDLPNLTPRAVAAVQGSLPGLIRRRAEELILKRERDAEILGRMKRVAVYVVAGEKDPRAPFAVLMKDAEWLRSFGADARAELVKGHGHEYPARMTPKILEWFEGLKPAKPQEP